MELAGTLLLHNSYQAKPDADHQCFLACLPIMIEVDCLLCCDCQAIRAHRSNCQDLILIYEFVCSAKPSKHHTDISMLFT